MIEPAETVFTKQEIITHECWPMLTTFVSRAAHVADEGPALAAWTTLVFHFPNDLRYWRQAVPAALADTMANGRSVTPAGWQALAWLLSLSVEDLKDRVSFAITPDPPL